MDSRGGRRLRLLATLAVTFLVATTSTAHTYGALFDEESLGVRINGSKGGAVGNADDVGGEGKPDLHVIGTRAHTEMFPDVGTVRTPSPPPTPGATATEPERGRRERGTVERERERRDRRGTGTGGSGREDPGTERDRTDGRATDAGGGNEDTPTDSGDGNENGNGSTDGDGRTPTDGGG